MNRLVLLELLLAGSAMLLSAQQGSPASQANADQQVPTMVYNLPSQPVGIDDLLAVSVYDSPELTRTVRVGADGTIRLPMLKEKILVQGKLAGEIETAIAEELKAESILVEPVVTVSVAEYKSRPISVVGAVKSPVTFQALPGTTLLDALTKAQGLSDDAGADIIVTRLVASSDGKSSEVTQRIPAKALMEKTDPLYNLPLFGGEQIRVPEAGKIFVVGNVKKPGAFSVHDAVGNTTVLTAIAMSEGLDQYAQKVAYIYRREVPGGSAQGIPVELAKILDRKSPDINLEPNDILYIPDAKGKRVTLGTIEKVLGVSATMSAAAIYATTR
jgi:polysaccharide export outer membrane protein